MPDATLAMGLASGQVVSERFFPLASTLRALYMLASTIRHCHWEHNPSHSDYPWNALVDVVASEASKGAGFSASVLPWDEMLVDPVVMQWTWMLRAPPEVLSNTHTLMALSSCGVLRRVVLSPTPRR